MLEGGKERDRVPTPIKLTLIIQLLPDFACLNFTAVLEITINLPAHLLLLLCVTNVEIQHLLVHVQPWSSAGTVQLQIIIYYVLHLITKPCACISQIIVLWSSPWSNAGQMICWSSVFETSENHFLNKSNSLAWYCRYFFFQQVGSCVGMKW